MMAVPNPTPHNWEGHITHPAFGQGCLCFRPRQIRAEALQAEEAELLVKMFIFEAIAAVSPDLVLLSSALRLPLRPERGESCNVPSPPWIYRRLHLATWLKCIPMRSPMARTPNPWAANSTTRALCANPCGVLWARINCCNCSFSTALNANFPLCLGIQNI